MSNRLRAWLIWLASMVANIAIPSRMGSGAPFLLHMLESTIVTTAVALVLCALAPWERKS